MALKINGLDVATGRFEDTEVYTTTDVINRTAGHPGIIYEMTYQDGEDFTHLGNIKIAMDEFERQNGLVNRRSDIVLHKVPYDASDKAFHNRALTLEYVVKMLGVMHGFGTCELSKIIAIEPHSEEFANLCQKYGIENLKEIYLTLEWIRQDIQSGFIGPETNIIIPDKGMYEKYKGLNLQNDASIIRLDKSRNASGGLDLHQIAEGEVIPGAPIYFFDDKIRSGGTNDSAIRQVQKLGGGPVLRMAAPHILPKFLESSLLCGYDIPKHRDFQVITTSSQLNIAETTTRCPGIFEFRDYQVDYSEYTGCEPT